MTAAVVILVFTTVAALAFMFATVAELRDERRDHKQLKKQVAAKERNDLARKAMLVRRSKDDL